MDNYTPLTIAFPEIAKEWDYEKNAPLVPDKVGYASMKKAFWICEKGHSYETRIDHRTIMHSGCPFCSGKRPIKGENDLLTAYPDIAKEWDYEKNDKRPEDFLPKSSVAVFWTCSYCGYGYQKKISSRTVSMSGCPNCCFERGTSFYEQSICFYLSRVTETVNRSKQFGREIDIFIPSLNTGIEYNGWYYHKNKKDLDNKKVQFLRSHGVRVIIIDEGTDNAMFKDHIAIRSGKSGNITFPDLEWCIRELFNLLNIECPEIDIARDQIQIKERYIISLKTDNFAAKYPELAEEWDKEKNGSLKPENFTPGSNHTAFFDCKVCGTVYKKKIGIRVLGGGCPVCAGKQVKKGYNDLLTTHPKLASEWSSKNKLKPDEVTHGSDKKVWWQCEKCNYEWQSTISSRSTGNVGCPVCAGKKVISGYNDLETLYPEIAQEWDKNKNEAVLPSQIRPGCNRSYWWNCRKCGNEWKASVSSRTGGCGCPKCGREKAGKTQKNNYIALHGSLSETHPDLATEWDLDKNLPLRPDMVSYGSNDKVWWICRTCNNSWQAVVSSRVINGNACPECGKKKCVKSFQQRRIKERGSLAELRPDLAAQWDYEANYPLTPNDFTVGSNKRASWICSKGHKWSAVISSRKKCGCPYCAGRKKVEEKTN